MHVGTHAALGPGAEEQARAQKDGRAADNLDEDDLAAVPLRGPAEQLAVRFADTVQGLWTLRLFGRERRAADRIESTADDYRRETMKVLRFSFLSGFSMELLASLAVALIAVAVGFRLVSRLGK